MCCPVCDRDEARIFLTRADVPVHQNLLLPDRESALAAAQGDLRMACCPDCGFVFNSATGHRIIDPPICGDTA